MRRHGRTDGNQKAIVRALRDAGRQVHVTSAMGGGFPDLVVCWDGHTVLMEVKIPGEGLTTAQVDFHATCKGRLVVVHTVAEALGATGAWVR